MEGMNTEGWDLTEEELALSSQLSSLDEQEEIATNPMAAAEPDQQAESLGAAEVAMATGVLMKGFEKAAQVTLKNPHLKVPPQAAELVAPKLEAVLDKHGVTTPGFLSKWREEIELGMTLGGLVYGMYQQHVSFKAHEAAQLAAQALHEAENVKEAA